MKKYLIRLLLTLIILFNLYHQLNFKVLAQNTPYVLPIISYPYTTNPPIAEILRRLKLDFGDQSRHVGFSVGYPYLSWTYGSDKNYDVDLSYLETDLQAAIDANLPILIHLNGHRWVEITPPKWTQLTDYLLTKPFTMMFTQEEGKPINQTEEWQTIGNRVGSYLFSLNEYNTDYRFYKKKNIQQVARRLAEFSRNYPQLFAGVSLDSEISFCPASFPNFPTHFSYDYNPWTVAQYRYWLSGTTGSYTDPNIANPYLSGGKLFGQSKNLTLGELENRYGINYGNWTNVFPPKMAVIDGLVKQENGLPDILWDDWLNFKASLTNNIIKDMVLWVEEAGIPRSKIYSHQPPSFIDPQDPRTNNDSRFCGIPFSTPQVAGAGYGITLYDTGVSNPNLFSKIKALNPNWGVFEWNSMGQTSDFALNALNELKDNGVSIIVPNYYDPNPNNKDQYNFYNNQNVMTALKSFLPKPGDLNWDKNIDLFDLRQILANFLNLYTIFDYNKVVGNFGK